MSGKAARILAFFVLALLAGPLAGRADEYPSKPITIVVPFPAGGGTDIAARVIADKLYGLLGQRVIVNNKGGAAGNIGSASVAIAPPDGYTLIMATQSTHGANAALFEKLPYDTVKDFAPVTLLASTPLILVASPKLGVTSIAELVALAKSKPGVLNYGSSSFGGSPHLAMELFKVATGIDMVHVPFQGSAPVKNALLSGDVQVMFDNIPSSLPVVRDGLFRALGVSSAARFRAAGDVPTVAEAGVPGFEMVAWYGVLAPANTPTAVVQKLNGAIVTVLKMPDVAERLDSLGYEPVGSTAEAFGERIRADMALYAKLAAAAKIPKQQ